jgi:hypothetical protein
METLFEIMWWQIIIGLVLIPPTTLALIIALTITYIKERRTK